MDSSYFGQLALTVLFFSPGLVLLALYVLLGPVVWFKDNKPGAQLTPPDLAGRK